MKNFKRTLSLALVLCLTLSLGIIVASASSNTVEYLLADDSITNLIPADKTYASYMAQASVRAVATKYFENGSKLNVLPLAYNKNENASSVTTCGAAKQSELFSNTEFTGLKCAANAGGWFAVMIKNPGAGTYSISLNYMETPSSTSACEVYAMSADVVMGKSVTQSDGTFDVDENFLSKRIKNAMINTSADGLGKLIADAMSGSSKLGTVNMYSANEEVNYLMKSAELTDNKLTFGATGDMILVFKAAAPASDTLSNANMLISGLSLTKAASAPTEPAPTEPEATEPQPTEPGATEPAPTEPGADEPSKTGETAPVMLIGMLMVVSLAAVCVVCKKRTAC